MDSNETNIPLNADENEQNDTSNWNGDKLDLETIQKLKGDAIGSTMYSESFVLKTLLKLFDLDWNESLEEDLCYLWDMTVEEEVSEFLLKHSFLSIAVDCINRYNEERLVEIIVGILGNITIKSKVEDIEVINSVMSCLIRFDDPLILIQVMRFIKGVNHFIKVKKIDFITNIIIKRLGFILSNSLNDDLLLITLDTLAKITTNFKIKPDVLNKEITNEAWVGYQQICKQESDFELVNTRSYDQQYTLHFVQIIVNICLYAEEFNNRDLLEGVIQNKNEFSNLFSNILTSNLNSIDFENVLTPIDNITEFYIEASAIIFPVIKFNYTKEIFNLLINVVGGLIKNSIQFTPSFIDLFIHFVLITDINNVMKDTKNNLMTLYSIIDFCEKNNRECFKNVIKINELKRLLLKS